MGSPNVQRLNFHLEILSKAGYSHEFSSREVRQVSSTMVLTLCDIMFTVLHPYNFLASRTKQVRILDASLPAMLTLKVLTTFEKEKK